MVNDKPLERSAKNINMTTPWDRIDADFRAYLDKSGVDREDFNGAPWMHRTTVRNNFQQYQQQKQQQQQQQQREEINEKNVWEAAAAAHDGGKGIPLRECDPDDNETMGFIYSAFDVKKIDAQLRLKAYIRRLRETGGLQQQQHREEINVLKDRQRKLEIQMLQTSMRLDAYGEDMLSDAFDRAEIEAFFWLPTLKPSQAWTGIMQGSEQTYWDVYKVVDKNRKDKTHIQAEADGLQKSFPASSRYTMKNTSNAGRR